MLVYTKIPVWFIHVMQFNITMEISLTLMITSSDNRLKPFLLHKFSPICGRLAILGFGVLCPISRIRIPCSLFILIQNSIYGALVIYLHQCEHKLTIKLQTKPAKFTLFGVTVKCMFWFVLFTCLLPDCSYKCGQF